MAYLQGAADLPPVHNAVAIDIRVAAEEEARSGLRQHPSGLRIPYIAERFMDIRAMQRPLKDRYRQDPATSRITLTARGGQADAPIACSVDLGRAIYNAQAHQGVGGAGTGACSGDLLLGALAACAQITCQMVAAAMGIPTEGIDVRVEGDLDLQGTLGNRKRRRSDFRASGSASMSARRWPLPSS